VSSREGEEAGVDRVHAKTANHLECDGEKPDTVAGYRHAASLIFKTVADPSHLRSQDPILVAAADVDYSKNVEMANPGFI